MRDLQVTLVQPNLIWENSEANREHLGSLLAASDPADIVILPEMFTTGFSMRPEAWAEPMEGPSMQWMREQAASRSAVVTGSIIIEENSKYFNRLIWMQPDGSFHTYDKRHLFSLAGEENHYTAGSERLLISYQGWRIFPQVCYDLRFPVWSRNDLDYDFTFYVANWPERRRYPWRQLLRARAIENQAYVVGVNRVGEDGNGVSHTGDSAAIDPLGEVIYEASPGVEETVTVALKADQLQAVRQKFRFLNDRDSFHIDL